MRFLIVLFALVAGLAQGAEQRTIGWDQLVPDLPPLVDPLEGLDMWERYDLGFAAKVLADAEAGTISREGAEYAIARRILDMLAADGLEADRLVVAMGERDRKISERQRVVNPALDGQVVRLPGYALPLSASDDGVREFLLVPYMGACIHYPPPPPNQLVRAELTMPHQFAGRYETVWITGRMIAGAWDAYLDYVDGRATVETSYTMEVTAVEPYAGDPSAETTLGSFSPLVQAPSLRLSRTGLPHPPGQAQ